MAPNTSQSRDEIDIERCMERERRFQVKWGMLSRNKLWLKEEQAGPYPSPYLASVEEYRMEMGKVLWPRGRDLNELSVYGQIYDFYRFMMVHTKPYRTIFMIIAMSVCKPVQTAVLGYVAQQVESDPSGVPLWVYLLGFGVEAFSRTMYWWYEMWVPLNSQRVQIRSVLLTKRLALPDTHPLATKWPPGRFAALLKDVDDVVNGIWSSLLSFFDDFVSVVFIIALCLSNLAIATKTSNESFSKEDNATYILIFLFLAVVTLVAPCLWFNMMYGKVQECEYMVREGQALYMSISADAVKMGSETPLAQHLDIPAPGKTDDEESAKPTGACALGRKAYWVFGRTTFRAFFHRLAWTTNYVLISKLVSAFSAYILLTSASFGEGNLTSILIVLISLSDLSKLSPQLLDKLILMSRGCHVLRDVADLLNADPEDLEDPDTDSKKSSEGKKDASGYNEMNESNEMAEQNDTDITEQ